jgi:large subunit ribosomal protein L6
MSRLGIKPVQIPKGVELSLSGQTVTVKGPKGTQEWMFPPVVNVTVEGNALTVKPSNNSKFARSMWGTTIRIIESMITGVVEGYKKDLELNGVGFRMKVSGKMLDLALGFSHPVKVEIPEGISAAIEKNVLSISGINKQQVGQFAAKVRSLKPVEPYKGKGFMYVGEHVRRKDGKKSAS